MKKIMSWTRWLIFTLVFSQAFCSVAEENLNLQYPELLVVPLASDRIRMESAGEQSGAQIWLDHSPILVASVMSIYAGSSLSSQKNDLPLGDRSDAKDISQVSIGVGAFWLAYSSYLAMTYKPYSQANQKLKSLSSSNQKEHLIKERLAEERIEEAAQFGQYLSWLSAGSLLASSVAVASIGKNDTESIGILSAVASLSPLIFSYRWQKVAHYHRDYKKRIYGPIVTSSLYGKEGHWTPLLSFSSSF